MAVGAPRLMPAPPMAAKPVLPFPLEHDHVWQAYWNTARNSHLDWVIFAGGSLLVAAHFALLVGRWSGRRVFFVQDLDRYRTVCLLLTDLLPVLGLLGTVLALMNTFDSFRVANPGKAPDLSQMVRAFAPAMSTTISGLMMIVPNLILNAILWLAYPTRDKGEVHP